MQQEKPKNNSLVLRYMGFAFQLMGALALAVFGGYKLDKWIKPGIPIFIWVLPLLALTAILIKVIKDTSEK